MIRELFKRVRAAARLLVQGVDSPAAAVTDVPRRELRDAVERALDGIGICGSFWAHYATSDELELLRSCVSMTQILRDRDWASVEAMRAGGQREADGV
jgi:hypothetical protein